MNNTTAIPNTSAGALVGKKVIIVEDDVFIGGTLLRHMMSQKINATLITTGEGAFDTIKKEMPDILILDINLPGMNGLDILALVRKDPVTAKMLVMVVSNTNEKNERDQAKNLGAIFLVKALVTPENIVEQASALFVRGK